LDGEWVMLPVVAMALPFEVAPLTTHFFGAMVDLEETFEESFFFWVFTGEILSIRTQLSMKAPFFIVILSCK